MPPSNEERTKVIHEYKNSIKHMKQVQNFVREYEQKLGNHIPSDVKPIIDSVLNADQFILPPELATSVNLGKVVASADYISEKLNIVQQVMLSTPSSEMTGFKEAEKTLPDSIEPLQYMKRQEILAEDSNYSQAIKSVQAIEISSPEAMTLDESYDMVSEYYNALADMQLTSRSMDNMVRMLDEEKQDIEDEESPKTESGHYSRDSVWDRIKSKIKGIFDGIKEKVRYISSRFVAKAKEAGESLSNALGNFWEKIQQGKNAIINGLHDLAQKLQSLISRLVEMMFKFLSKLGALAKRAGFGISKVEVKIPTIKLSFTNFFGIPIPIPNISPPDMTISIEPSKDAPATQPITPAA